MWIAALTGSETPAEAFHGFTRADGVPVPDFTLTDQDGRRVTPDADKPAIYAFIYSHCEDSCPAEIQQIAAAMDNLGHDIPVYGISVDPANDTQASAKRFLLDQKVYRRVQFLLGSEKELAPVWKGFATSPQRERQEHSAGVVLALGGEQRFFYPAASLTGRGLAGDLKKLRL